MKNICFVCFDLSVMGGAEKVATSVASALSEYYNVHLLSLTGGRPLLQADSRVHYANLGLDLSRLRRGIVPAARALRKYYKENNIELSFLEGNYTGFVCCFTSLVTGTRQVFHDHGALMSQWDKKDIRTIRRIASRLCDYTLALTEESADDYVKMLGVSPKRADFIHNWIESVPFCVSYKEDSRVIMSAGRFAPEKEFHTLLPEVAVKIKERHPDWQWHIYGDGECFGEAEKRIKELGLTDFVLLKGRADDLEKRYEDCAMFVLTSNREGLPLVLLEAKAKGLPIVSFDIKTGPSEIVRDGQDGVLCTFGDTKAMAEAVCGLIENRDKRCSMSAAAKEDAQRFSKDRLIKCWTEYIENHTV